MKRFGIYQVFKSLLLFYTCKRFFATRWYTFSIRTLNPIKGALFFFLLQLQAYKPCNLKDPKAFKNVALWFYLLCFQKIYIEHLITNLYRVIKESRENLFERFVILKLRSKSFIFSKIVNIFCTWYTLQFWEYLRLNPIKGASKLINEESMGKQNMLTIFLVPKVCMYYSTFSTPTFTSSFTTW